MPGDLRAWDAKIDGPGWVIGVEAETRLRDLQEIKRRIALKQRDDDVDHVILLLSATRNNRAVVREFRTDLVDSFPVSSVRAIERLSSGASPRGSAVVIL
jgi:hypothetical protein